MFTKLLQLDYELFKIIHLQLQHPILDVLLVVLRNPYVWFPFYMFVLAFLIINYGKKCIVPIIIISCSIGMADATSSHLVKKNVKRLRPCKVPELKDSIRPLVGCGRAYSFTSSHAANHFSMAIIFGCMLPLGRRWKIGLLVWAASICYAQVYVAAHFPTDVIFGALLGMSIAFTFYTLYSKLLLKQPQKC